MCQHGESCLVTDPQEELQDDAASAVTDSPAGFVLSDQSMVDVLDRIMRLAIVVTPGADAGAVAVRTDGDPKEFEAVTSTSPAFGTLEAMQSGSTSPTVETFQSGREGLNQVPTGHWPEFDTRAAALGVTWVWSMPLRVNEETVGVLTLYSTSSGPLSSEISRGLPTGDLASLAAAIMASAAAWATTEVTNIHLRQALDTRDLIGQAKGVLMARQGISSQEAFDILRRGSQRLNTKLRVVAEEIIAGLAPPGSEP
jgi:hypothetical protein